MTHKDDWMTEFYGQDWFLLGHPEAETISKGLYELRISAGDFTSIQSAQENGFFLVETQMEFRTMIDPAQLIQSNDCRLAKPSDLDLVLEMTRICFTDNPAFENRFKNLKFFNPSHADAYYQASIKRCFEDKDSVISIAVIDGKVCGYFMMIKVASLLYKGIMTAVLPEFRGHQLHRKMQAKCYGAIGQPFQVINKTQLQNLPVLNNHIKEGRILTSVEHLFYKKVK